MNEYLIEQYKILHKNKESYGNGNANASALYAQFFGKNNIKSVLDFGCGKGNLVNKLKGMGYECDGYDPSIEQYRDFPDKKYDCVISNDVFEHLEETNIVDEFNLIKKTEAKFLYFIIHTKKASNVLPDGQNCHTIVRPKEWWKETIERHFSEFYDFVSVEDYSKYHIKIVMERI
jgi:2-polyprenyl-3-methyl-5-hydroxy-6-metoxy-1,4-benzoquinol methylase